MKAPVKTLFVTAIAIIFSGCLAQKSSLAISLPHYSPSQNGALTSSVATLSVTDIRKNKSIVATINDSDGSTSQYFTLDGDLAVWLQNALKSEIKNTNDKDSIKKVEVFIGEFNASLTGYTGQNLRGNIELFIKIHQNGITTTTRLSQPQSEYSLSRSKETIEKFINSILLQAARRAATTILAD